jgi:ribosomal protein S18 acetylase RimI-like enzyme
MHIALDEPPPVPRWPDGIAPRSLRVGEERRVYDVSQAAFADHWGFEPGRFDRWLHHAHLTTDEDRAFCFLALDGDEIVGVARCQRERGGSPGLGWVEQLAVLPTWRRRGIALALLQHAFGAFHAAGQREAGLDVDGESATGALELYERAGMRERSRTVTYERPLTAN